MAALSRRPLTYADPVPAADVANVSSCYNVTPLQSTCSHCEFVVSPTAPLQREIDRRRVLAIISHPDAGKTTITEKLLLFGNLIQMAGTVKGKKSDRHATSDWMAMEQQGDFGDFFRDAVPLQGSGGQSAGHAGP